MFGILLRTAGASSCAEVAPGYTPARLRGWLHADFMKYIARRNERSESFKPVSSKIEQQGMDLQAKIRTMPNFGGRVSL